MWHEVCYFCRFPLLLPKGNIDALSYYPRAILDSFWVRTETEAGRCCPYLFTAATSQLSSIVPSRLVDMLMTQRTMLFFAIVYQLVITWTVNQTRLGTNSFLVHVRRSHTFASHQSRAETVSVLLRLIRFEPLLPLSVMLFMPRISCRSLRVMHFCSKTTHTPCWVSWSRCLSSSFTLACLDWRLGAVALTS